MKGRLASPRWALVCAAIAFVVSIPALFTGFAADDYVHRVYLQGTVDFGPYATPWWKLFTFFDGDPARTHWLVDHGVTPWWSDPEIRVVFFRPVSSATHWFDIHVWPDAPVLQHLHSIAWYVVLVLIVARIYRRMIGPTWVAGLAGLFYALDQTHGIPVAWIANRNATVAATFALGAFALYVARRPWLAAAVYAIAFASGEAALGAAALFFGYEIFLDDRPVSARLRDLTPVTVVIAAWAVFYRVFGYGVAHSGIYLEPLREPLAYLGGAAAHLPLLAGAELGAPSPDPYMFVDPPQKAAFLAVAFLFIAWAAPAAVRIVRVDRTARFFLAAGVVSVLPSCATFPSGRLMLIPSFAFMGLLAKVVEARVEGRAARSFRMWTLVGHLALSPIALELSLQQMHIFNRIVDRLAAGVPSGEATVNKRLVVLNAPDAAFIVYCLIARRSRGDQVPHTLLALGPGSRPFTVMRSDARTLVLHVDGGFYRKGTELLTRKISRPLPVGTHIDLTGVAIDVRSATPDGVPDEASFRFEGDLDGAFEWREWDGATLVPFHLPAVGETRAYPGRFPTLW